MGSGLLCVGMLGLFLDGSEREYFISGVVKGLVIKGDVVSEIYRLICVDLEIT